MCLVLMYKNVSSSLYVPCLKMIPNYKYIYIFFYFIQQINVYKMFLGVLYQLKVLVLRSIYV